jgi:hypothetical protein
MPHIFFQDFTVDVSDDSDYSSFHWFNSGASAIPGEEALASLQLLSGRLGART